VLLLVLLHVVLLLLSQPSTSPGQNFQLHILEPFSLICSAGHVQAAQTGWLCAASTAAATQQHTRQQYSSWSRFVQGQLLPNTARQQDQARHLHQQQQHQRTPCSWSLQHSMHQQQCIYSSSSSSRTMSSWSGMEDRQRHSTTILCVRRGSEVSH
jgi:hypothetical protein